MSNNPQEEDKNQEARIVVKVKSIEDGDEVFYGIKKSTKVRKLMYAYCDRRVLKMDAFSFIFDGALIRGEKTPDEAPMLQLNMKDGDEIDVLRTLSGGLRANQRQWSYMLFDKIE